MKKQRQINSIQSIDIEQHEYSRKYINDDWGTVVYKIPRNELQQQFLDEELRYNCIYLLIGLSGIRRNVYVGQAKKRNNGESVLERLREHDKSTTEGYTDKWNTAIVFTNKLDTWKLDDLNALEYIIYNEIKPESILNSVIPNYGGANTDDYTEKLQQIKNYTDILGYDIFKNNSSNEEENDTGKNKESNKNKKTITTKKYNGSIVEKLKNGMARIPEVITPPDVAAELVDKLPDSVWNDTTVFLDPACKGGEILLEIYNRLMNHELLKTKYPNIIQRSNHILKHQLYGIAISQTSLDRTSTTLFDFDMNIKIIPDYIHRLKGAYLGKKQDGTQKTMQDILNEEYNKEMKIDVVIGNPPYQEMDGGGGDLAKSSTPLYDKFIHTFMNSNINYLCFVIPSRWMSGGKPSLDNLRRNIIESKHLEKIYNYEISSDVFRGVDIAGGVQYILLNKTNTFSLVEFHNLRLVGGEVEDNVAHRELGKYTYIDSNGNEQYMIIASNKSDIIIDKIMSTCKLSGSKTFKEYVSKRRPFGITSDFEDSAIKIGNKNIEIICSNGRITYTDMETITSNKDKVDKYKVCAGKVNPDRGGLNGSNKLNVINKPFILNPNIVCSESYLVISSHATLEEAHRACNFIKTKLARFEITVTLSGMNITNRNYMFVPYEDFSETSDINWNCTIPELDQQLYKKYNLTQEEIDYIENTIKPME